MISFVSKFNVHKWLQRIYGRLVGGREFVMGEGEEAQIKGIEANEKLK